MTETSMMMIIVITITIISVRDSDHFGFDMILICCAFGAMFSKKSLAQNRENINVLLWHEALL